MKSGCLRELKNKACEPVVLGYSLRDGETKPKRKVKHDEIQNRNTRDGL